MTYCAYVRFDGIEGETEAQAMERLRLELENQPYDWYLDDVEVEPDEDIGYNGGGDE